MSWPALRWPLAITLAVTLLRLLGERLGWSEVLFGTAAGGGGALIGIGWLVPVFGWWFGARLARAGDRPRFGRATALLGAGIAAVLTGFTVVELRLGTTPLGMAVGAGGCVLGGALAYRGWPLLGRWLLAYAVGARLPIVAITAVAIASDWGTHYEKLAAGAPEVGPLARWLILTLAQATFWLPITILGGTLAGLLAAWRTRADRVASGQ